MATRPLRRTHRHVGQQVIVRQSGRRDASRYRAVLNRTCGYTLGAAFRLRSSQPALFYKSLPYDPLRDFVRYAGGDNPSRWSAPQLPVRNPKDPVALAIRAPAIHLLLRGVGNMTHLAAELIRLETGLNRPRPYKAYTPP